MGKTKVIYRVRSLSIRPGDEATVDSEVADALVANGHAIRAKDAPAEVKDAKKS